MNPELAIESSREAIKVCILIGGPILGVCLLVGLLLGLVQAMSQIQDQAISAVPKILAVLAAVGLALPWMSEHLGEYAKMQFGTPLLGQAAVAADPVLAEKPTTKQMVVVPASNQQGTSPYYPSLGAKPPVPATRASFSLEESGNSAFLLPHHRTTRLPDEKTPFDKSFKLPQHQTEVPEEEQKKKQLELPRYRFSKLPGPNKEG